EVAAVVEPRIVGAEQEVRAVADGDRAPGRDLAHARGARRALARRALARRALARRRARRARCALARAPARARGHPDLGRTARRAIAARRARTAARGLTPEAEQTAHHDQPAHPSIVAQIAAPGSVRMLVRKKPEGPPGVPDSPSWTE